jgi:hypothetical protein
MLYSPVGPPVQLSFRFPGQVGFAHMRAVRPGSPNPAIHKPVRRDARQRRNDLAKIMPYDVCTIFLRTVPRAQDFPSLDLYVLTNRAATL